MDLEKTYNELIAEINEIDEKLDSRDAKFGKRSIINNLIKDYSNTHESYLENIKLDLLFASNEKKAAVFYGLVRNLNNLFEEEAQAFVNEIVAGLPEQEPLCTEEEAAELREVRFHKYQKVKKIVDLAQQIYDDVTFEMPGRRKRVVVKGEVEEIEETGETE
jgi:hypothetical protein